MIPANASGPLTDEHAELIDTLVITSYDDLIHKDGSDIRPGFGNMCLFNSLSAALAMLPNTKHLYTPLDLYDMAIDLCPKLVKPKGEMQTIEPAIYICRHLAVNLAYYSNDSANNNILGDESWESFSNDAQQLVMIRHRNNHFMPIRIYRLNNTISKPVTIENKAVNMTKPIAIVTEYEPTAKNTLSKTTPIATVSTSPVSTIYKSPNIAYTRRLFTRPSKALYEYLQTSHLL